mgnify:CR=1 FL=1|tara:strand:- start:5515 stop:6144 length:630 start_codon:yes stop_codon:yes gene_type:complete
MDKIEKIVFLFIFIIIIILIISILTKNKASEKTGSIEVDVRNSQKTVRIKQKFNTENKDKDSDSESDSDSNISEECDCNDPNCDGDHCPSCTFTLTESENFNLNIPPYSGPDVNYNHSFDCPSGNTYNVDIELDIVTLDGECNLIIEELPTDYTSLSESIPLYNGIYDQNVNQGSISVQVTPTLSNSIWLYSCYGGMSTYPRNLTVTEQ